MNIAPKELNIRISCCQRYEVSKHTLDSGCFCGSCFKIMLTKSGWASFIMSDSGRSRLSPDQCQSPCDHLDIGINIF